MDLNDPQANRPYTVIGSGPIPDDTTPDTLRLPFIQDYVCRSHVHPSLPDDRILVVELSPHRVDLHWKAGEVSKEFVRDNDELVRHTVRGLISVMVEPSAPDTVQVQDRVLERTEYHAELRPLDNFRNGSLARMTLRPGEVIWFVPEHHVSKAALNEINLAAEEFTTARFRFASLRATHHKLF